MQIGPKRYRSGAARQNTSRGFCLLLRGISGKYMYARGEDLGAREAWRWRVREAWQEMSHGSENITTWGLVAYRHIDTRKKTYTYEYMQTNIRAHMHARQRKGEKANTLESAMSAKILRASVEILPVAWCTNALLIRDVQTACVRCDQTKKAYKKSRAWRCNTLTQLIQDCVCIQNVVDYHREKNLIL